jgi:RNA polymerase sigma-70 factor (ECF subfamily)
MEADQRTEDAVARVREGDVDAFEAVVYAHEQALRAWLAVRCPVGVDEDELAQRAFVKAFRLLETYRPGTSFRPWLLAIARNLLLAECRLAKGRSRGERAYADALIAEAQARELEEGAAEGEERIAALRACLEELPRNSRELLDLRYTRGESIRAVAESVGRSAGAIKKHLFFIRRRLHECVRRRLPSAGETA